MKKQKDKEVNPPIIEKSLLLEIEKTFRRIWDKEKQLESLFKKSALLREETQSLLVQEFCKTSEEQNTQIISSLRAKMLQAEESINACGEISKELQELREYFYGWLSEPRKKQDNDIPTCLNNS